MGMVGYPLNLKLPYSIVNEIQDGTVTVVGTEEILTARQIHHPYTCSMRLVPQRFAKQIVEIYGWPLRSDNIWNRPVIIDDDLVNRGEKNRLYSYYDHMMWFTLSKDGYDVEED